MNVKGRAALTLFMLLVAGVVYAKDYEVSKKAGDCDVFVQIDKNPPVVGDNNVSIEITDASGHKVKDAKVIVEYSMPAMPGMPPMNYKVNAELKGEQYKTTINPSMAGSWNVSVKIVRAGKTSVAKFIVDAK